MRDPERITRITRKLEILWLTMPDMRFGQMAQYLNMGNTSDAVCVTLDDAFYVEDDEWEKSLDEKLKGAGLT